MIFVALEWCVGDRGGGTHQWNLYMADVQYNRRVRTLIYPLVCGLRIPLSFRTGKGCTIAPALSTGVDRVKIDSERDDSKPDTW